MGQIELSGPTNFAPIINQTANRIRNLRNVYTILLIITDGAISDLPETKSAIVAASSFPLSIIIVGVGSADFSSMDVLDADDAPLTATDGSVMRRDIVQFVPFSKHQSSVELLASETLAEVPEQFTEWAELTGLTPPGFVAPPSVKSPPPRAGAPNGRPKDCTGCQQNFSMTHHRHHCAFCGKCYCANCVRWKAKITGRTSPPSGVSVCAVCVSAAVEVQKL
eukprot:NODE_1677_length_795_cov_162.242627_g1304_i0.p1 GENE.NODE_1677_length_795_cov_162.242627_g1304_i0~~NODE_1677_length_795_cov_162.242627_g1304_i0.p1  ORF type:complete len:248 (+),score=45.07 NODE_1677_length_795_cov_162.242627_g1304_i0:80-745(+)